MERLDVDVLVVGAGAAGLRAAFEAATHGSRVLLLCKGAPGGGTSTAMSGGVFRGSSQGGDPSSHFLDTLKAGRGLNKIPLVEILVQESAARLQELLDWGLPGETRGGFLFARGAAPAWGRPIVECLKAKAQQAGVRFLGSSLLAWICPAEGGLGALAYRMKDGKWLALSCGSLILATGGGAALYARHDNPRSMLGEGYYLALEAGAELQDMEFVQFYPLGLAEPGLPSLLIPPRLADKGALSSGHGEDILAKYGIRERPAAERARDKLSQAIFSELREDREVWLDLRAVDKNQWMEDPLSASCVDLLGERFGGFRRPLRVAPMAHFLMGGISTDAQGATNVPGLFAAGEAAGGLHGANRLGGNALAETLVFGARVGRAAALSAMNAKKLQDVGPILEQALGRLFSSSSRSGAPVLREGLGKLRKYMWEEGGIIRSGKGLQRALALFRETGRELTMLSHCSDPVELVRTLELRMGVRTATLILEAALRREESRGAHFREDFPKQDDRNWLGHLKVKKDAEGAENWSFQPVAPREATEQ